MHIKWYQQLRWRLLLIPLTVVLVGGITVLFLSRYFLLQEIDQTVLPATREQLTTVFQRASTLSILGASFASIIAGAIVAMLLWKALIVPLRQLAESSQRIANGKYAERIPVPTQVGNAIQQLVVNYNQMAKKIEAVERQRIQTIGDITHELRTPLSGLKGYVEGIEDGIFEADHETLQAMNTQIGRLQRLVEDVQQLSQLESQSVSLEIQSFDIHQLVQRTIAQLVPYASEQGIELEIVEPERSLLISADKDRTAQIITNLVGNSIRYGVHGGTTIVRYSAEEDTIQIHIQDNGIGLEAEQLPLIFERFYRVEHSRTSGGTGVGLTISRHFAWAMNGDLTVHSDGIGKGTCFTVSLPLHTPPN